MTNRSYREAFLKLGFTELNGKPKCIVCLKVLSAELMKKNKLQCHLETNHTNCTVSTSLLNFLNVSSSSSFEGHPLQARHKQDGAEGLSFYLPRLLHFLDQMLAVMSLSQHRVSSSKTVSPRAPCGARCIGHAVSTWSAVCSEAPHSQFGEGARPHLCMDEWNRPTPVRRRLSLTQAARGKPIPTGLAPVWGTKARSLEAPSQYSVFHLSFIHSEARMPSLARLSKRFRAPGTNGRLDLSVTWRVSEGPLKDHARYDRVQRSTVFQGECRSHSEKLSWLDA